MTESNNTHEEFVSALSTLLEVDVDATRAAVGTLIAQGYKIPTPPIIRRTWQPSEAALATARESVTLMDIPVSIARYSVVKAEAKKQPTSAEWLRWLLADEQKQKEAKAKEDRETRQTRLWHSVAD